MNFYLDAAERFTVTVDATTDWSATSPCEGWTAADVVDHVVDTERQFLEGHGAELGERPTGDPDSVWTGHLAAVRPLAADEAFRGREFDGFFGRTTIGATLDAFYGFDLVVHGWDLARATGQDDTIDPDEVVRIQGFADSMGDMMVANGVTTAPVDPAPDATAQERLLNALGRRT